MEIVFLTAFYLICSYLLPGFPGGSDGKESICNAGDPGSTPFFFFFFLIFYQCSLFLHMDSHYYLESFYLSLKLLLVFFCRIGLLVTNSLSFYLEMSYFLIFEG